MDFERFNWLPFVDNLRNWLRSEEAENLHEELTTIG